jgi:hypothetical protein
MAAIIMEERLMTETPETPVEVSAEERKYAEEYMQEFTTRLVARGLTAWPAFVIPGTKIAIEAGRIPGVLYKVGDTYKMGRK